MSDEVKWLLSGTLHRLVQALDGLRIAGGRIFSKELFEDLAVVFFSARYLSAEIS